MALLKRGNSGLLGGSIGELIDWSIGGLLGWMAPGLLCWIVPGLADWMTLGLADWMASGIANWMTLELLDWMTDWLLGMSMPLSNVCSGRHLYNCFPNWLLLSQLTNCLILQTALYATNYYCFPSLELLS